MRRHSDNAQRGQAIAAVHGVLVSLLMLPGIAGAQHPTEPPAPMELRPLQFPPFQELRLENGLEIVVVENHRLPIVSISLNMPAGSRFDPPGHEGLAGMVAELITKGTTSRTAEQIAEQIERVGASLSASAGADFFRLGTTVLTDHVELGFELLSDVLLNATYPDQELELARRRALSGIRLAKSDPGTLASQFFARELYGDHPYGRHETEASVNAITAQTVREFARTRLAPRGALLVLAGDVTPQQARALAQRFLGSWRGGSAAPPALARPPAAKPTNIVLVHRPGSEQSNIRVGNLALAPGDPLYYGAVVANKILGGGTDARLFMILREQKSWTYGAYSGISRPAGIGYFQANTEVRNPVTDSALVELLAQLRRIRTETVSDSELAAAKGFLVGSFPLSIQTPQQIAGQVATVKLLGLGEDYLRTYRERLAAVPARDVQRAAQRVIKTDSLAIVVVGDGQLIHERLTPIAPVRIVDVDGTTLTPDELTPRVTAVAFDLSRASLGRDSFAVMVQGNAFGGFVTEITTAGDTLVYAERVSIPMAGVQSTTTVRAHARTLAPFAVESRSTQGGQQGETKLTYHGTHVTGTATVPQAGGPKTVTVDTTLAEGTLDDEMLHVITIAAPLTEGASFTVNAFDAAESAVRPATVRVVGAEQVTVPAGAFEAYRLEVSSGRQTVIYFVTRATPHRVVKLELVGQPVTFELVGR